MTQRQGPRNAVTNPNSGLRWYPWQGRRLTSVTSLRRLAGLPFGLATWQVNQALKAAVENSSVLDTMVAMEGADAATKWLRELAMYERDTAANRGTDVHEAASNNAAPTEVDPVIAGPLMQYYDFLGVTKAEVLLSERQVYNLEVGYAGSLDLITRLLLPGWAKRRTMIIDIKTGKNVYPEHALQLIFYALAEFIGEDDVIDNGATDILHNAQGLALLHLTDTSWELIEIRPTPELYDVALSLARFALWVKDHDRMDNLITRRYSK